jgi:hypothetical protein
MGMGGEGAAAVGEWAGMVVGWVKEQAVVVGSQWLCWLEEVGGEGARMGSRVREEVRVVGVGVGGWVREWVRERARAVGRGSGRWR